MTCVCARMHARAQMQLKSVVHAPECVDDYTCVWGSKQVLSCPPLVSSILLTWDGVFHWTRSLCFQLGWLAQELKESVCL